MGFTFRTISLDTAKQASRKPQEWTKAGICVKMRSSVLICLLAQLPNVLHGPASSPLRFGVVVVCAGCFRRRLGLDQILNEQAVLSEETNPLSIGQLEMDL